MGVITIASRLAQTGRSACRTDIGKSGNAPAERPVFIRDRIKQSAPPDISYIVLNISYKQITPLGLYAVGLTAMVFLPTTRMGK